MTYLDRHGVDWRKARLEDVAGFVAWLRLPPQARDGRVTVLPTVEAHCSESSVNRKLSAVTSFCGFHARHGVELSGLLITMQPTSRHGRAAATSYRPFLHDVSKRGGERRRTIKLKAPKTLSKVLTVQQVQVILDACEHLRDRLLFALMLDTGVRVGEALGLRTKTSHRGEDGHCHPARQRQSCPREDEVADDPGQRGADALVCRLPDPGVRGAGFGLRVRQPVVGTAGPAWSYSAVYDLVEGCSPPTAPGWPAR